jgi:hypothetical protein
VSTEAAGVPEITQKQVESMVHVVIKQEA